MTILLLALSACNPDIDRFSAASPTLSNPQVLPVAARLATAVTITAAANFVPSACQVSVGGQRGTCTPPSAQGCACTFVVDSATPEGALNATVTANSAAYQSTVSATLQVDKQGPIVDASGAALARNPIGQVDTLTIAASSIVDPSPAYATQAVATVSVWSSAVGGQPVATAPFPLTAPLSMGSATQSFPQIWISATDAVGNEGARTAITAADDTTPPVLDDTQMTFFYNPVGVPEQVSGNAGSVSDNSGAIVAVRFFAAATDTAPLASPTPDTTGAIAATSLGDLSAQRIFVEAEDKAGNVSARSYVKNVQAIFNLVGRQPHDDSSNPMSMYRFSLAISVGLTTSPAMAFSSGSEVRQ